MDQKIVDLYALFSRGMITRREFATRIVKVTGSAAVAATLLGNPKSFADVVPRDDERLYIDDIKYPVESGKMMAYLARPKAEKKYPAVIVIHENRGLNDHIRDVTRRMALEGFLAIAPDALSASGGTPPDEDMARTQMRVLDYPTTVKNFTAAVKYLKTHPQSTGKVGCTGFCWGGAMTNQVAVNAPDLDAAVPYYGRQPEEKDVTKIQAPLMMHYGGTDERINAGIADFEKALKSTNKEYQSFIYDGAGHAFNNDTGTRYDKEAADLAWSRTVAFFKEKLAT